ncbi:MAG: sigma-70 family RNA polymerase sigma factor [Anaerolineae bacterium]|nr:MAG: sigma-70 family RNA polymerase sigma factor [Anaerolineae bacterium]
MVNGLEAQFEKLWGQTSGQVRAYMFCACRSWADADDLAQDCYLRALRGWNQFNGTGSRKAWLFGIARRTRADWFRRGGKKATVVELASVDKASDDPKGMDEDLAEAIWQAVRCLDDKQSEVIHLRFAAGLSYAEIADAAGVPIGTVRSRLHKGLKNLRQRIGEREYGA